MFLCSSLLECKYFLVGTIVWRGVRVEVGVEIHVESFCAETPDCEKRRQQAIFFILTLIVTCESIYCCYNLLFKRVVSGDRRAQSRGAGGVQSGDDC